MAVIPQDEQESERLRADFDITCTDTFTAFTTHFENFHKDTSEVYQATSRLKIRTDIDEIEVVEPEPIVDPIGDEVDGEEAEAVVPVAQKID
jgi:hypothetical protein